MFPKTCTLTIKLKCQTTVRSTQTMFIKSTMVKNVLTSHGLESNPQYNGLL